MMPAPARQRAQFAQPIFIGLGSNLGSRAAWLARATAQLRGSAHVRVLQSSAIYETEPVGVTAQPHFLNQVAEIATSFSPFELLAFLLNIEHRLGRRRRQRWGPRNIDLDVLAFQTAEIQSQRLIVPHPEIARRRFVLVPWCEIAADFIVPRWNVSVQELLARCEDPNRVVRLPKTRG